MVGHRERIKGAQLRQVPTMLFGYRDIAPEGCRVARDVGHCSRSHGHNSFHRPRARAGAGWVENHEIARCINAGPQPPVDGFCVKIHLRQIVQATFSRSDRHRI